MTIKKFLVIGLGHFGLNLALRLSEAGAEVIAIDNHQDKIDLISDRVTHALCMDSTDARTMKSLGIKDVDTAIVAIGEGFESSILTTAILQEIGVKRIMNRVISPVHERLLKAMNITELLVPEAEAAEHLANRLMIPGLLESYELSKEYGIFEVIAPEEFIGKTLLELNLRKQYNMNLITIKRKKKSGGLITLGERSEIEVIGVPSPELKIIKEDILILFGKEKHIRILLESSFI